MAKIELRPEDRQAIESLLNEIFRRRDYGQSETVSELFTEDAVIVTPRSNLVGRPAIHAYFIDPVGIASSRARHFWTNLTLTPLEDGSVAVNTYALTVLTYAAEVEAGLGPRVMAGSCRDIVVRQAGEWRVASRRTQFDFTGRLTPLEA